MKPLYLIIPKNLHHRLLLIYCYLIGIRKGTKLIVYHSGHTNSAKDGFVKWGTITSFTYTNIDDTNTDFSIGISFKSDTIAYSHGHYNLLDVKNYIKAQPMLLKNFTTLEQ